MFEEQTIIFSSQILWVVWRVLELLSVFVVPLAVFV
jgi:hypothetical protein